MTTDLCEVCRHVDIRKEYFVYHEEADIPEDALVTQLGRLGNILDKNGCALCRLIAAAIGGSPSDLAKEEVRNIKCTLAWEVDAKVFKWKDAPTSSQSFEMVPRTRCLRAFPESFVDSMNEGDYITLLCDENSIDSSFLGRAWRTEGIDFEMIKSWLETCHSVHGDCGHAILPTASTKVEHFKLIDVHDYCVVDADIDFEYFTLSYVWGDANNFLTTTANIHQLYVPGALHLDIDKIPASISDAMVLVAALGFRYLWVDSICIVQDDATTKQAAINSMDLVYARSLCTIIAGAGNDAQAGLRGVRPNTRGRSQIVESVGPLKLMCPRHLDDCFTSEMYDTRAWTYQERQLSNRILFFVGGQAIYQCPVATWREDVVADLSVIVDSLHLVDNFRLISGSPAPGFVQYMGLIHHYSARQLTFETDVLNAFEGVAKVLSSLLKTTMHWGLPRSLFDWALLWEAKGYVKRRPCCPSWSWTGYVGNHVFRTHEDKSENRRGHVGMPENDGIVGDYTTEDLNEWLRLHTWIEWYHYERGSMTPVLLHQRQDDAGIALFENTYNGKRRRLSNDEGQIPGSPRWSRVVNSSQVEPLMSVPFDFHVLPKDSEGEINSFTIKTNTGLSTNLDRSGLLHFWTVSGRFRIAILPTRDKDDHDEYTSIPGLQCYGIYDLRGVFSGDVWVRGDWEMPTNGLCDFLVLSDALPSYADMEEYSEEQYERYEAEIIANDSQAQPFLADVAKSGDNDIAEHFETKIEDITSQNEDNDHDDDDDDNDDDDNDEEPYDQDNNSDENVHKDDDLQDGLSSSTFNPRKEHGSSRSPPHSPQQNSSHMYHLHNIIMVEPGRSSHHQTIPFHFVERVGHGKLFSKALDHAYPPGACWKEVILA